MSLPTKTSNETPAPTEVAGPPASAPETPEYKPHPLAGAFPRLPREDFDALVADIKEHGQRDAILLTPDDQVLDGINRLLACREAGIEPRFEITNEPPEKWVALVISKNLVRRHLTPSQRAAIAAELVTTTHGTNQHSRGPENFPVLTQADAAEKFHVNDRYVRDAVAVKRASEGLHGLVKAGGLSVSDAAGVVRAAPGRADTLVELVEGGEQPEEALREILTTAGKPTKADKPTLRKKGTGAAKESQVSQKRYADPDAEYAELLLSKFGREGILVLIPLIEVVDHKRVASQLREKLSAAKNAKTQPTAKEKVISYNKQKPKMISRVPPAKRVPFLREELLRCYQRFEKSDHPEAKDKEILSKLRRAIRELSDKKAHERFEADSRDVVYDDRPITHEEIMSEIDFPPVG